MQRYAGTIVDILFTAAFLLLAPQLVSAIATAAKNNPNTYIYTTALIISFHPLMCWAILQKIGTEPILQEGLRAFNKGLWKWYTWPLGMMVYFAIFSHSLSVLALSASFGDWKKVEPTAGAGAILGITILFSFAFACVLLVRLFRGKKIPKKIESAEKMRWQNKIAWMFVLIILSPLVLSAWFTISVIFIFCLYFVVWLMAGLNVQGLAFLPDTKFSRLSSSAILFIYAVITAFYFEKITTEAIFNSPLSYGQALFFNAQFLIMFYVPFRLFFALYSGNSKLSWATFGLSLVITYLNSIV